MMKIKELIDQLSALDQEFEVAGSVPVRSNSKMKDTYTFGTDDQGASSRVYVVDGVAYVPMRFKKLKERK